MKNHCRCSGISDVISLNVLCFFNPDSMAVFVSTVYTRSVKHINAALEYGKLTVPEQLLGSMQSTSCLFQIQSSLTSETSAISMVRFV